ncbi:1-phosphatidylinositol-4-phosphate 5-kinase KNAG_0A04540 [Huiozyma naganishii CBS 8797]|uniref:1-phosphatidylinositol-4-phosphate 5-kinase n=1 Tax=Huiozyma naganishii (strain ATCC MYA-139 / BCRC 22969 / CBS 8797 / KCTC 17520 / NBRC 10181 / NCYC 3082 / Yp74L-3) TaxID=1071383 RepID=J7S3Q9_HUIN7|nr:hypothetical protein KNAG_0A04540 [Kazachstania naganishii CBS 8797]CCK68126.1 hypothetical protein KNAG_0A04540 [Kazachstania naganishii CBS 8797]
MMDHSNVKVLSSPDDIPVGKKMFHPAPISQTHKDTLVKTHLVTGDHNKSAKHTSKLHTHTASLHSLSNSESNAESARFSDGELTTSTPTSLEETALRNKCHSRSGSINSRCSINNNINNKNLHGSSADVVTIKRRDTLQEHNLSNKQELNEDITAHSNTLPHTTGMTSDQGSVLTVNSLIENDSYIQDIEDDRILLNKKVSRRPVGLKRKDTRDSTGRTNIPFQSTKHSQILPVDETDANYEKYQQEQQELASVEQQRRYNNKTGHHHRISSVSLPMKKQLHGQQAESKSAPLVDATVSKKNKKSPGLKKSDTATREIQKMRKSLLHKREMRRNRKAFLMDDDRVLIGNKVSEGHVNFIIAYNMLTGIRVAVSRCSGIMKPLTPADFKCSKKLAFDYHGNELTPSSQYAFKFKDYCPEVFRELRALFGLDPADYLVSLTSKYILSELNSPGKSGSFFYYSRDYRYIIKTIHHSEHIHLRRHVQEYYNHVRENPNTLICQFYGLHRVKMPISFQNKIKHRRIYFLVMNNLFPPKLELHKTFDLKGSTWGRLTTVDKDRAANDPTYRPVLKDLNWLQMKQRIQFGPERREKFLVQLRKDVALLIKLNIMDYSLLLGIHDIRQAKQEDEDTADLLELEDEAPYDRPEEAQATSADPARDSIAGKQNHTTAHSNIIPHYFKSDEGGIRSSLEDNSDGDFIYYVGIIDCLTNYSLLKKLESFWRSLSHDPKVVSAVPPKDYGNRFYHFMLDSVDAKPMKPYKDDPAAQPYQD